jgi:hypothetical protein
VAVDNKDFKIKNGLVVQGSTATVDGNDILTTASSIDDLANVDTTGVSNGNALVYSSGSWIAGVVSGGGGGSYTISDTAPESPNAGDLWFSTIGGTAFIYYNDGDSSQWIEIGGIVGPQGPQGATGAQGPQGIQGDAGADGIDGADPYGIAYNFDSSTTASDPGAGNLRLSVDLLTASIGTSYQLHVSETDNSSLSVIPVLNNLTISSNPVKANIILYKKSNKAVNAVFDVTGQTDNGTWRTLDVTYLSKSNWSSMADEDEIFMLVALVGDKGDVGASAGGGGGGFESVFLLGL